VVSIRAAFTMIELIFAIIVIAITVVSLPMMTQVTAKGVEANIDQEAIFATSAKMMQILSFAWDKNSIDANVSRSRDYAKVIDITHLNNVYGRKNETTKALDTNSTFRIGHVREGLHRRFFDNNEIIVAGVGIEDQSAVENISGFDNDGYKFDMTLTPTIKYVNNDAIIDPFVFNTAYSANSGTTPTNIKLIEISTTINNDLVLLRAYAANIGEIDFNKRRY